MTLLTTDGFDVNDYALRWSNTSSQLSTTTTRFASGRAITPASSSTSETAIGRSIPSSAKVIIGCAATWFSNFSVTTANRLIFLSSGGTNHIVLGVDSIGRLTVSRGSTVIATSTAVLASTTWGYYEISATVDPTAGRVIVKAGGVTVIDFTGNTSATGSAANIDAFSIGLGQSGFGKGVSAVDDLYVCNGLGTVNNDFLGDVRIFTLLPTAAGSSTQFTPTGVANNWDNVNDVPPNAATFNSSSTVGQRDTYAMSDVSAGYVVVGVTSVVEGLKSDVGAASVKAAVKSGATVAYGTTVAMSASNAAYADVWEKDPATAAAWTLAGLNAAEFGAEVA